MMSAGWKSTGLFQTVCFFTLSIWKVTNWTAAKEKVIQVVQTILSSLTRSELWNRKTLAMSIMTFHRATSPNSSTLVEQRVVFNGGVGISF